MKLFSFKKQNQQAGFAFQIEDMFALKNGGVVVAGQITEGALHQGEQAVCVPKTGNAFLCVIESIEMPDPHHPEQYIHPSDARANGPWSGRCALMIPNRSKSDFHPGDRLVPVGSVPLEELQVTSPEPSQEFLFRIDHIFSIRNVGTATAGTVLNGSAGIGDTVSFGHTPGEAVFTSKIKAIAGKGSIEGGIGPVDRATADGPCRYGCSLILDESDSHRFQTGAYLFIQEKQ